MALDYRNALITGASSGIGHALASHLAEQGVEVVAAARRRPALDDLVNQIRAKGGRARALELDVSKPEETVDRIKRLDDELEGLDLVVANAGVGGTRWSGKLTFEDCAPIIDINVRGAVATLVAVSERMARRRRGHLVGVSSLAQYRGLPRTAAYSASKAFLSTFLEGLRLDLRSVDVFVTDVRPGYVRTPLTEGNRRSMPLLMEVDDAARIISRGMAARRPVVAFPWQLDTLMKSTRLLPNAIFDRAVGRVRK